MRPLRAAQTFSASVAEAGLGEVQLAGGALVLAAVVILCVRIEMAKREVTA